MDKLTLDDVRINGERHHGVTAEEARGYIRNARFSLIARKGKYTNLVMMELIGGKKICTVPKIDIVPLQRPRSVLKFAMK